MEEGMGRGTEQMRVQPERLSTGMPGLSRRKAQKMARSCTEGVGAPGGVQPRGGELCRMGPSMEKEESESPNSSITQDREGQACEEEVAHVRQSGGGGRGEERQSGLEQVWRGGANAACTH